MLVWSWNLGWLWAGIPTCSLSTWFLRVAQFHRPPRIAAGFQKQGSQSRLTYWLTGLRSNVRCTVLFASVIDVHPGKRAVRLHHAMRGEPRSHYEKSMWDGRYCAHLWKIQSAIRPHSGLLQTHVTPPLWEFYRLLMLHAQALLLLSML